MLTSAKFSVSWVYREGDDMIRRFLSSPKAEPCIEAARLMNANPYVSDVEVLEIDTGSVVDWAAPGIGKVLVRTEGEIVR